MHNTVSRVYLERRCVLHGSKEETNITLFTDGTYEK